MNKLSKLFFCLVVAVASSSAMVEYPGGKPGASSVVPAERTDGSYTLVNAVLNVGVSPSGAELRNTATGERIQMTPFAITLEDGTRLEFKDFKLIGRLSLLTLPGDIRAARHSERIKGQAVRGKFNHPSGLAVQWTVVLRDGSHYVRQELMVISSKSVGVESIVALDAQIADVKVSGFTAGSLIVSDSLFAGVELPTARNSVVSSEALDSKGKMIAVQSGTLVRALGEWHRGLRLEPKQVWSVSSVVGLLAPQQARRSFAAYMERERAHPYHPFVHYNTWYELNIGKNDHADPMQRMVEKQCVDVINEWNTQLKAKRGVAIDGFVFDDGWDDFNSLWSFHKGFPRGFAELSKLAGKQGAGVGAWLSPWGGYGGSKSQRVNFWNSTHANKIGEFRMDLPEYYAAFRDRCSQMLKDYDMRYFKFDGIGAGTMAEGPGKGAEQNLEGLLRLTNDLRSKRSDVYINCTVGTWPSPFWLRFADSIWRQGSDWATLGELGDNREKWITYRDEMVYKRFVERSPLNPINSLMFHGLIIGDQGPPSAMPNDLEGIKHEIRCAFGCGSSLQELYVSKHLATPEIWDEIAKGIKWFRANMDVLDDVHWVGGTPYDGASKEGYVYGWAAWKPKKAVLTLRNASDKAKSIKGTLRQWLDVPPAVKGKMTPKNAYDDQRNLAGFTNTPVDIDEEIELEINPLEVFVFDLK